MRKEFNIENYLTGKYDVVTRDGCPVQILRTDVKDEYPIIGIITVAKDKETHAVWYDNGCLCKYEETGSDLFLVSKTEKLYLVHYLIGNNFNNLELQYRIDKFLKKEDADIFIKDTAKLLQFKVLRTEEVEVDKELL